MKTIEEIKQEYNDPNFDVQRSIDEYSALIAANPDMDEAYVERGLLYWKLGKRAEAINDYNEAIGINPASRAVQVKEATSSILDFYNKDLYNP